MLYGHKSIPLFLHFHSYPANRFICTIPTTINRSWSGGLGVKNLPSNAGDSDLIPGEGTKISRGKSTTRSTHAANPEPACLNEDLMQPYIYNIFKKDVGGGHRQYNQFKNIYQVSRMCQADTVLGVIGYSLIKNWFLWV